MQSETVTGGIGAQTRSRKMNRSVDRQAQSSHSYSLYQRKVEINNNGWTLNI